MYILYDNRQCFSSSGDVPEMQYSFLVPTAHRCSGTWKCCSTVTPFNNESYHIDRGLRCHQGMRGTGSPTEGPRRLLVELCSSVKAGRQPGRPPGS